MFIKIAQEFYRISFIVQPTIIPSLIDINETLSDSLPTVSLYHEDRNRFVRNRCSDTKELSRQSHSKINHRDSLINYLGFFLRSHSLFYCSVPKVATRTLLILITYLHIRDDLIPLLQNQSISNTLNLDLKAINRSNIFDAAYFNRLILNLTKVRIRICLVPNVLL